jgi:hypothetical protein
MARTDRLASPFQSRKLTGLVLVAVAWAALAAPILILPPAAGAGIGSVEGGAVP